MTSKDVFHFIDYTSYLNFVLSQAGQWGAKTKLAVAIGVQSTYVTQILKSSAHLSMEQAELANHFFQHNPQESHFFLLLVQKDRAGTKSLREYYQHQLDQILKSRMILNERLTKVDSIKPSERSWYYSSWLHAAIHMALTLPQLRRPQPLSKAFHLSEEKIFEILERLEAMSLITKTGADYMPSVQRIRLSRENKEIINHHTGWRLQAIQDLEYETLKDLHYSGVVTLSEKDAVVVKDLLLECIKKAQEIIKDSPEEKLYVLNMDFFGLLKPKS